MFQKSKELHQQQKAEEAQKSDFGGFEQINYTAWVTPGFKTVRLLGNPLNVRNSDPYSPKIVDETMIVGDDGKRFRCIYPRLDENPNHILRKISKEIASYDWDDVQKVKKYHIADSHPDILKRIVSNCLPEQRPNAIDTGWRPSAYVVWNVIDREKMDWHKENKHTMLFSKKASPIKGKDGEYFYSIGVPYTLYKGVHENIVNWAFDWEDYDVIVRKLTEEPWYKVFHASESMKFIDDYPKYDEIKEYGLRPLTDEEAGWERYNIDELFPVTSAAKIKKHLSQFIREVDAEFDKNYMDLLDKEIELEEKEKAKASSNETYSAPTNEPEPEKSAQDDYMDQVEQDEAEQARPERQARKPRAEAATTEKAMTPEKAVAEKNWDFFKQAPYNFTGMDMLTEENLADIVGWDEVRQEFTYDPSAGDVYDCPECGFGAPGSFEYCPKCGIKLGG